ncbi:MAG: DNA-directed DNA polymerase II small subunit [Candidatus Bathyarchaeia archaeon]
MQTSQKESSTPRNLREAIETLTSAGYQLEAEAFELIRMLRDEEYLEALIYEAMAEAERQKPKPIVITKSIIIEALERVTKKVNVQEVKVQTRTRIPLAKEVSSDFELIRDGSEEAESSGTIDDFNRYFKDRFNKLSKIIRERLDFKDARDLTDALESKYGEKVKMVATVMDKRERSGQLFFDIEDLESTAVLMVPRGNRELYDIARTVLPDQVIGIEASHGKSDLFIAEQIILPDIPERRLASTNYPINAVLISDIHFGSRTFRDDAFERFIMWLNGKVGSPRHIEAAFKTKYILIAGDLVDGIGVYPRQEEELAIPDIYRQYRLVAQYIEQIPDYIEVIIIPGNHDAVRQALPQPAIPKEFAEPILEAREVKNLGNPSEFRLHGIHFLMYHGRSLDDIVATVPNLNMRMPERAMEYLLKCRHLAPEYGGRTSLAPESRDRLIIAEPPNVFQSGHMHVAKASIYRGTILVNCGTWQEQTEYQRRIGIEPTPGVAPILNLQTMQVNMMDFLHEEDVNS